ncbi:MAG: DMT family transporter [Acidobacteriota bacterium]
MTAGNLNLRGAAAALGLCALWGGVAPTVKIAVTGMPPLAAAAARFAIGLLALWLWCRLQAVPIHLPRGARLAVFLYSLVFVGQIACVNQGVAWSLASHVVVLVNTSPLFVALLAHFFLTYDRLSFRKLAGLAVAFAGVAYLFLSKAPEGASVAGDFLGLFSGFLLAVLHVTSKRLVARVSPVQLVLHQFLWGVPIFVILSALLEPHSYRITLPVALALLYQGIGVAAFCFVSWLRLLQRFPASQLASVQFTIPVFGVILSHWLLGEPLTASLLVALPAVALGIWLVSRGGAREVGVGG